MTLQFNFWAGLFFFIFFIVPMLGLWANASKDEDNKYKLVSKMPIEPVDLSKMGANDKDLEIFRWL